ncbi:MAG: hypothetical protein KUG74_04935 [Rhodobacteraceae bacterium]|nr:hypothetical protein [Paracoccaceae bacterium]
MTPEISNPAPQWLLRLCFLALFFAVVRNLLPPNAFTATVLLFDYEFGLIRRGLIGEIANLFWGDTVSRGEVFLLTVVTTLFGVIAAVLLFFRRFPQTIAGVLLLVLVFSSFAFAAIIASTGYIDLVLIGLVCLSLFSSPAKASGIAMRLAVCALGMMMHEVMLPYFTVFFAFDIWISRPTQKFLPRASLSIFPMVASLVALLVLINWGQLPDAEIAQFLQYIDLKSEFTAEPEATIVMERTIGDNLQVMAQKRQMMDYRSWVLFDGLSLFAMTLWVLWLNFKLLRPDADMVTRMLLVAAILAPLSLNLIAFDVVRFGAMSVFVGFLAISSQLRADAEVQHRLSDLMSWPLFVTVLLINLNIAVNQMNTGEGHQGLFPWVLVEQLGWL